MTEVRNSMKIYNTQTRAKEDFEPLEPGKVKMYVCGPTVYNFFHLGNARPFITYDTMRRYLEYSGYEVIYVQNFTDIDDKMINRANEEKTTVRELADKFIAEYFHDADRLNIRRATFHPRATECIDAIIEMIRILEEKGYAYQAADGIYFDVGRLPDYGKLSRHPLDELHSGARTGTEAEKRSNMDFALWKNQKPDEPAWDSPWGKGRPGWHIECSAMIRKYLGETIDIHGGGQDLVFPHHENEIAQSEAVNDKPFVRYWLHNGFINIDHEKMSKSAGNFFTVRDLVQHYDYMVLRFFMLGGHYRMPINFSADLLEAAQSGWERICTCLDNLEFVAASALPQSSSESAKAAAAALKKAVAQAKTDFVTAMDDDLNTADALAAIFELVRGANTAAATAGIGADVLMEAAAALRELLDILGLKPEKTDEIPQEIWQLVEDRAAAKKAKDYARADEIRDMIQARGFQVDDTPQGPKVSSR